MPTTGPDAFKHVLNLPAFIPKKGKGLTPWPLTSEMSMGILLRLLQQRMLRFEKDNSTLKAKKTSGTYFLNPSNFI